MEGIIAGERSNRSSFSFVQDFFGAVALGDFAVKLWDGTVWKSTRGQRPRWTMVLNHPGVLRTLWRADRLKLSEAYIFGDFDIEGQIEESFPLAENLMEMPWTLGEKLRFWRYLFSVPNSRRERTARPVSPEGRLHSRSRDAEAIRHHYDVSNEFYRLFLDENMVYSCAYFSSDGDTLDQAQERKLDYICRKLRLEKGEQLLDIGCGWGALVLHAARHYGVEAHGITLSRAQAELANERILRAGLAGRCRVDHCDYRDLQRLSGYDKIVSIGMLEHVGESKLPTYFEQVYKLLRPGGAFLNQGIASCTHHPLPEDRSFIRRYVFPDSELLPVSDILRIAEMTGFEVRDMENLREHSVMTLRQWVQRLEEAHSRAVKLVDETTYRTWRLYMAGAAYAFRMGRMNLCETLMVKPEDGQSRLPLTREDWYV